MIEISFSGSFKSAFKRRIAGDSQREYRFWRSLEAFRENPFTPDLRTHKLSGKLKDLWSFTVEYDCRVVFYFDDTERVTFVDIGTHNEVY